MRCELRARARRWQVELRQLDAQLGELDLIVVGLEHLERHLWVGRSQCVVQWLCECVRIHGEHEFLSTALSLLRRVPARAD